MAQIEEATITIKITLREAQSLITLLESVTAVKRGDERKVMNYDFFPYMKSRGMYDDIRELAEKIGQVVVFSLKSIHNDYKEIK